MELDTARIEDAVIREVADKMIGDDDLFSRAKQQIEAKIDALWAASAETKIAAIVDAAIQRGFDYEYQRVDSFGRGQGEKTTIRAELEELIAGYWNTAVDKQGKPSNGYGEKLTRAEYVMAQMVAKDLGDQMRQHVVIVGGALKDGFRRELYETVNRLLSEVFHVHSS